MLAARVSTAVYGSMKLKEVNVDLLFVFVVQGGRETRAGGRAHHSARVLLPLGLLGGRDLCQRAIAARLSQPKPPGCWRFIFPVFLHFSRRLPGWLSGLRGRKGQQFREDSAIHSFHTFTGEFWPVTNVSWSKKTVLD